MLLILSDSFKALWQFVFPVVALFMGGVKSADPFCTASGFLLSIGIEASGTYRVKYLFMIDRIREIYYFSHCIFYMS